MEESWEYKFRSVCEVVEQMRVYSGGDVLDFGCGEGLFTSFMDGVSIFGYDSCLDKIKIASDQNVDERVVFSSSRDLLVPLGYDAVVSAFVLHEVGPGIFGEIYDVLRWGGYACIADYEIGGMSRDDFSEFFVSDGERVEVGELGLDRAWRLHIARSLEDCVRDGEAAGFETIDAGVVGDDYFLWVGRK